MAVIFRGWRLEVGGWRSILRMLFALSGPALAQITIAPATQPDSSLHPPVSKVQNGKKFIAFDGRPLPLFWANGLTQVAQLDEYREAGFNTLVVRVPWQMAPDGALEPSDLKATRSLAEAGARLGLWIIYQLPAAPEGGDHPRISADSSSYTLLWSNWIAGAITQLSDTPRLAGWMLPDDPRGLPIFDSDGFTRWIKANYADVGVLNAQWNTHYASLDDARLPAAEELGAGLPSSDEIETPSLTGLPRSGWMNAVGRGWAFHPAALAIALYKADAYRDLLQFWTQNLRESDSDALLFSGRLPDYAQLLSLPDTIDIAIPDMAPSVAQPDALTHNPQAISVARRAGRFAAIPTLSTNGNPSLSASELPRLVASWADAALAHGAAGLAFDSWPDLQRNVNLRSNIAANLARLQMPPFAALWNQAPQATAAIMLTPLGEGQSVQNTPAAPDAADAPPDNVESRGLFGFGDNLVRGEPDALVYALRWGSAFGSVDFLAPEDVADDNTDLSRYNALLLPQALSLPDAVTQRLARYASEGGVVVADLGAGAAQSAGRVGEPPPAVLSLFGITAPLQIRRDSVNFSQVTPHPLFPSWSDAAPGTLLTASGLSGKAFAGPVGAGLPRPGTVTIGSTVQSRSDATGAGAAFLTLKPAGAGGAVFAPVHLWQGWAPGMKGFDAFHGDLFSRGARIVQAGAQAFAASEGDETGPAYPEIVNFPDAVVWLNHRSPGPEGLAIDVPDRHWSQVQTGAPGNWLWSNVACAFSPPGSAPATGQTRLAPIPDEGDAQIVALHAYTPPGAMLISQMLPVRARNSSGGPLIARVLELAPQHARIALWPNAAEFTPQGETFTIKPGNSANARLELFSAPGAYEIAPGSRHRVTVSTLALPANAPSKPIAPPKPPKKLKKGQPEPDIIPNPLFPAPLTREIVADEQGHLGIDCNGAALMVEIAPADAVVTQ